MSGATNLLVTCSHHGKIISVTDLVRNAASIAREVEAEGTVHRIARGGRGSMVLVDEAYFNGWMAALDELRGRYLFPSWYPLPHPGLAGRDA